MDKELEIHYLIRDFQKATEEIVMIPFYDHQKPSPQESESNLKEWVKLREKCKRKCIEGHDIYDQRVQEATFNLEQTPYQN